jgi:phospholipase/carboxylesterase
MKIIDIKGNSDLGVVWLHGFGANAWDLLDLADYCDPESHYSHFFPNGPLDLYGQGERGARAWFPLEERLFAQMGPQTGGMRLSEGPHERVVPALPDVDWIVSETGIELSKLVIGGFSQGAILALHWMLERKVQPRGLILLSGAPLDRRYIESKAPEHSGQRFFQSHGTQDPVLNYAEAETLRSILKKAGFVGRWVPFAGGHAVSEEVVAGLAKSLTEWRKI